METHCVGCESAFESQLRAKLWRKRDAEIRTAGLHSAAVRSAASSSPLVSWSSAATQSGPGASPLHLTPLLGCVETLCGISGPSSQLSTAVKSRSERWAPHIHTVVCSPPPSPTPWSEFDGPAAGRDEGSDTVQSQLPVVFHIFCMTEPEGTGVGPFPRKV